MLELAAGSLVEMNNSSFNCLLAEIEFGDFGFGGVFLGPQDFFEVDSLNEVCQQGIFAEELVLESPARLGNLTDLVSVEDLELLIEVELVDHGLHDLLDFVCHY